MNAAAIASAIILGLAAIATVLVGAPPGHRDDPTIGRCYQRVGYQGGLRSEYLYREIPCP